MTTVVPHGPLPGSQTPSDPAAAAQSLSWEGDKMFNIYIYDYCYKRGFRKTAQELLNEAEIPPESTPPINARQGLLFEWWSVFWVLFTAKANGNGTEDAMLYTQHQAHQATLKQSQNRPPAPQAMSMQPTGLMGQPPIGRPGVNGIGPPRFAPNGVMTNGIPPGNPQPPGPTAFAGGPMQSNGIMPGGPPPGMGQQPFMGRPPLPGQPRPPNGGPPFQSPTMAHSPPNAGPSQPQHMQPQHGAPPMGQLGPPHRGMLPPGQGMNPGQQTATPYQNIAGRPPSRASTPQSGMMNPSPSMASRQPPGTMGDPRQQENNINAELQSIPPQILAMVKAEIGLAEKGISSMTVAEKTRIIQHHRQRSQKPGPPGAPNAAAGPSMPPQPRRNNKRNSTSPGEDQQQMDDGLPRNGSSPPDRKRVRRSPMEPPMPSAPMSNYPHPNQPPQPQPGGPGGPGGPSMGNGMMRGPMGGGMGGPMNGGFPPQGQPSMQQMSGNPMGMLGMNPMMPNSMPNSMSPQMHSQSMMQYRQNLHNMQGHPGRMMNAGSPGADPSFNPGVPMPPGPGGPGGPGQQQLTGGQFAPGSRLTGPPNPKPMSMLPPPSPAKDQNGPNKDNKGPSNGMPEGSPRNQPLSNPNPPGTAPPTPNSSGGPGGQQQQQQNQQQQQQQQQNQAMSQSPGMLMNPNAASMNPVAMALPPAPAPESLFSTDFIQNVANGLDEFDVGLFRGDGDLNFERDFGQWFSNPDDMGGMELGKQ
ncbi:hypothetical protein B0H16DRAFT_1406966 [Mycena metata]|uniref:LisH domain-containing protein n=1 Tax=Mycena metata TaxID=1033252 RepID=A0AAD7NW03_9AGAR|nr:hypothetical protein B0H16DRAFT_1406966 [Mycena metata]